MQGTDQRHAIAVNIAYFRGGTQMHTIFSRSKKNMMLPQNKNNAQFVTLIAGDCCKMLWPMSYPVPVSTAALIQNKNYCDLQE